MGFWKSLSNSLSYLDPTRSSGNLYNEHPIIGGLVSPLGTTITHATGHGGEAVKNLTNTYEGLSGARDARNAAQAQQQAIDTAGGQVNQYYQQATDYQQPLYNQGMQDYATLGNMVRGGQFDMPNQSFVNPEQQPGAFNYAPQSPGAFQFNEQQPGRYVNAEQQPGAFVNPEQQPGQYVDKGFNFDVNQDPGAKFRMEQGTQALNTNAATRGGGLSGSTLKALSKYGQNLGSQEYGAAYGRYQDQRNFGANQNQNALQQFNQNRAFNYGVNQGNLAQFNLNRNFGYGMNQDQLAQYNTNRNFGAAQNQQNIANWQNNRNFAYQGYGDQLGQYNTNRAFNYGNFTGAYDRANQANTDRYNRYASLANVGTGTAANLGNIAMSRGDALGNLAIQRGNAQAQGMIAPGNANRALAGQVFDFLGNVGSRAAGAAMGGA